jgi:glycine hydroxymethyltransferase
MREGEMHKIAELIDRVLQAPEDRSVAEAVHADVRQLTAAFPLYPEPAGTVASR